MYRLRLVYQSRLRENCLCLTMTAAKVVTADVLFTGKRYSHNRNDGNGTKSFHKIAGALITAVGVGSGVGLFQYLDNNKINKNLRIDEDVISDENSSKIVTEKNWHKTIRNDLPTFRMASVEKHNTLEKGIWVTYGIGVYDITKFIPQHPGSDKIMLGAGAAIDPFWHIYQQHNTEEILKLLETFRIGNLSPEDEIGVKDLDSPWANEPKRHPILKPASMTPFNAEPPLDILAKSFVTSTDIFYIRNHLPVPDIDQKDYELTIEEEGAACKTFTIDDLKKLPKQTVMAAVMCGGNRRSDMHAVKPVKGLFWGAAAIGNAEWSGVRLRDVLISMGVAQDENRHVIMEGQDLDPTGTPYAASIPLYKAMDDRGDVLLAYEMNGKPLTRDHGYPLRVIVPGVVGARNVKWVTRIVISENESDSHWQQNDYKGFSPSTDWDTVDFSKSPAIQNLPVTSAICSPLSGDKVKVINGFITVHGYAWSGGGNQIVRVDVTADGGDSWHVAELEQRNAKPGRHWSWTLWIAKIPVGKDKKEVEIWAKAVDSNYNCQPETFKNTWNLRGVLSHAYHRVKIQLI